MIVTFLMNLGIAAVGVLLYAAFGHELRAILTRTGARRGVYRAGYEAGYESGHQAGRRVARPVVVPLQQRGESRGVVPATSVGEVASDRPPA